MPRYCCVPNCSSNKPGQPYVSVFRFPKDEQLLQTWKKKIPRDFKNSNNSEVCIKHFPEPFTVRKDKITDKTDTITEIPRVYSKLSENAYPCIFSLPGCPSYLNEKIKERYGDNSTKGKNETIRRTQLFTNFIKKEEITSFECLKENILMLENLISDFLSKNVLKHDCESCITFLFMNCKNCPILKSLKINTDLSIVIFNNNRELNIPSVRKILNNPPRLTYFSELLNILNTVNVFEEICSINSVPHHVMAIQSREKYIENCNAENFEAANFILEQMKLLTLNKHGHKSQHDVALVRLMSEVVMEIIAPHEFYSAVHKSVGVRGGGDRYLLNSTLQGIPDIFSNVHVWEFCGQRKRLNS
ncbi:uncharacterized protein TNCV_2781051 [Trichonephila clavipes]|nr:uncharacterized protein TNCV_2781051 [Trichonephila clavipes]